MVNPHRASAAMLALPLPLEYIVTLGNGGRGDRFSSVTQTSMMALPLGVCKALDGLGQP